MNIHEYQAKQLLRRYRVTTPRGEVVYTSKAAGRVAEELGGQRWVVKAQIHAGGRGKAGGVKIGTSPAEIVEIADQMLGSTLVTAQTGPEGQRVSRVLVERASRIEREFYLSMVVDRDSQRIVVIASDRGGVDIEDVAASTPTRSTRSTSIPVSAWSTSSAARSRRRSGSAPERRRSRGCSSACTGSSATSTA